MNANLFAGLILVLMTVAAAVEVMPEKLHVIAFAIASGVGRWRS